MNGRASRTLRREARAYVQERIDSDADVAAFRAQLKDEVERFARERMVLVEVARLARVVTGECEQVDFERLTVALDALDEVRG